MSTRYRFPEKLQEAIQKADPPVQEAFLHIINSVGNHCREHHGTNRPDYTFNNDQHFCGITPQKRRIKVGITNQDARISSKTFDIEYHGKKWTEFWVDPEGPGEIQEATLTVI